jgi:hypothetical protein
MTGSLAPATLLTRTTAGVVALVTLWLVLAARRVGLPLLLAPVGIFLHVVSIRQSFARFASRGWSKSLRRRETHTRRLRNSLESIRLTFNNRRRP